MDIGPLQMDSEVCVILLPDSLMDLKPAPVETLHLTFCHQGDMKVIVPPFQMLLPPVDMAKRNSTHLGIIPVVHTRG